MNQKLISLTAVKTALVRLAGLSLLAFSVSVVAAPPVPTLSTPVANPPAPISQSDVRFSWYSSGATSYRLVISQNSSFSGFRDVNGSSTCDSTCFTIATSSTSYTKSMDLAGKTYYWKVRANNSTGASSFSGYRYFTTAGSSALTGSSLVFPSTGSPWKNDSGSLKHITHTWSYFNGNTSKAINDSNALDLNMFSDADANRPVYPVANGTVVLNNSSSGFVVIKHTTPLRLDNGAILNPWYSGYMHMANRYKTVGASVTTTTQIGNVSAVGADGINHLHFAIYQDGSTLSSIYIKGNLSGFASKISYWY